MTPKPLVRSKSIFMYVRPSRTLAIVRKGISVAILVAFMTTSIQVPAQAQAVSTQLPWMPKAGTMVSLTSAFNPAQLKGMVIHPDNALQFDFLIHRGDDKLSDEQKKLEYNKLIKYFLASLAVPDENQWVNLSPYEKDRIIKDDFGKTEMGRDLLAQDYILKQITASLIYPESGLGQKFWDKVYTQAQEQFGTTNIPMNTFNKVWVVADEASIYEKGNTIYIVKQHLKVMLEQDYLSLSKHAGITSTPANKDQEASKLGSQIVREIVLPALEKEVNEGKNFAMLRQVYSGMLLAVWYKRALKESLLGKIYANKSKVKGVDQPDTKANQEIYQQYVKAFKKGVFNYIKEDVDKLTNQAIPRKYFSGGMKVPAAEIITRAPAPLGDRTMLEDAPSLDTAVTAFNADRDPGPAGKLASLVRSDTGVAPGETIIKPEDGPDRAMIINYKNQPSGPNQTGAVISVASYLSGATVNGTVVVTEAYLEANPEVKKERGFQNIAWKSTWSKVPFGLGQINMSEFYTRHVLKQFGGFQDRLRGVVVYQRQDISGGNTVFAVFIQPHHSVPHVDPYNAGAFLEIAMPTSEADQFSKTLAENPAALFYALIQSSEDIFARVAKGFLSVEAKNAQGEEIGFYGPVNLGDPGSVESAQRAIADDLDAGPRAARAAQRAAQKLAEKDWLVQRTAIVLERNTEVVTEAIRKVISGLANSQIHDGFKKILRTIRDQVRSQTITPEFALRMIRFVTDQNEGVDVGSLFEFIKYLKAENVNPKFQTWEQFLDRTGAGTTTGADWFGKVAEAAYPQNANPTGLFKGSWVPAISQATNGIELEVVRADAAMTADDARLNTLVSKIKGRQAVDSQELLAVARLIEAAQLEAREGSRKRELLGTMGTAMRSARLPGAGQEGYYREVTSAYDALLELKDEDAAMTTVTADEVQRVIDGGSRYNAVVDEYLKDVPDAKKRRLEGQAAVLSFQSEYLGKTLLNALDALAGVRMLIKKVENATVQINKDEGNKAYLIIEGFDPKGIAGSEAYLLGKMIEELISFSSGLLIETVQDSKLGLGLTEKAGSVSDAIYTKDMILGILREMEENLLPIDEAMTAKGTVALALGFLVSMWSPNAVTAQTRPAAEVSQSFVGFAATHTTYSYFTVDQNTKTGEETYTWKGDLRNLYSDSPLNRAILRLVIPKLNPDGDLRQELQTLLGRIEAGEASLTVRRDEPSAGEKRFLAKLQSGDYVPVNILEGKKGERQRSDATIRTTVKLPEDIGNTRVRSNGVTFLLKDWYKHPATDVYTFNADGGPADRLRQEARSGERPRLGLAKDGQVAGAVQVKKDGTTIKDLLFAFHLPDDDAAVLKAEKLNGLTPGQKIAKGTGILLPGAVNSDVTFPKGFSFGQIARSTWGPNGEGFLWDAAKYNYPIMGDTVAQEDVVVWLVVSLEEETKLRAEAERIRAEAAAKAKSAKAAQQIVDDMNQKLQKEGGPQLMKPGDQFDKDVENPFTDPEKPRGGGEYLKPDGSNLDLPKDSPEGSLIQPIKTDDEEKKEEYGGIDLNAANLNLQIKRDGKGVPLPFSQQDINELNKIEGLIPVILEIKPASLLPVFAELKNPPIPVPVSG